MLKKLLIGLLAIVAIVLTIAARQSATFAVARYIDIRATPATLAPLTGALRVGNPTDKASTKPLDVIGATSTSRITMTPNGAATRVTWQVQGPLNMRTRLITSFIGMDILLGSDLEKGLKNLKAAAEK